MYPFISIIVPVYNGEAYLEHLFQSLLGQTDKEFEVIFVDDGSTDGSSAIINTFAKKYQWAKAIHQSNGGPSAARNTGLKNANGSHVLFLDSDDYLERNTVELIRNRIRQYDPDLIVFGMNYVTEGKQFPSSPTLSSDHVYDRVFIEDRIIPRMINILDDQEAFIYDYACGKVFKRSIIELQGIRFLESRRTWEDRPFVVHYLKYSQNLFVMEECLYNYVNVPGSLSTRFDPQMFDIILENYELYHSWFRGEYDFQTQFSNDYWSGSIDRMISRSLKQSEDTGQATIKIKSVIQDQRVRKWFEDRVNSSRRDRELSKLILDADFNRLLRFYRKERAQEQMRAFFSERKKRVKDIIRPFIKKS